VLVFEGAVVGLGLVLGTVFALKRSADVDDIESARAAGPSSGCNLPEFASQCNALTEARDRYERDKTIESTAFIVAGVAGIAGAATWLLWPSNRGHSTPTSAGFFVGPNRAVVSVASSF
jgi:hypothetical protein